MLWSLDEILKLCKICDSVNRKKADQNRSTVLSSPDVDRNRGFTFRNVHIQEIRKAEYAWSLERKSGRGVDRNKREGGFHESGFPFSSTRPSPFSRTEIPDPQLRQWQPHVDRNRGLSASDCRNENLTERVVRFRGDRGGRGWEQGRSRDDFPYRLAFCRRACGTDKLSAIPC